MALTEAMTDRGFLAWDRGLAVTDAGARWLAELGIVAGSPSGTGRPPVRACLDWTERRPHLAGAVGAALCTHALRSGWIVRIGTDRAVAVTDAGRTAFRHHLGLPERFLGPPG